MYCHSILFFLTLCEFSVELQTNERKTFSGEAHQHTETMLTGRFSVLDKCFSNIFRDWQTRKFNINKVTSFQTRFVLKNLPVLLCIIRVMDHYQLNNHVMHSFLQHFIYCPENRGTPDS